MRVLIVDDNSANRMTLKWVLSKFDDLYIEEADSGQAAINACEKQRFDLIFMDVMMPGMTGIEATKEIKKIDQKSMVIAVTALDDDETTKEMFRAGAEDYITKPLKQDIFKARLQNYFKIIENRNFYSLSVECVNVFEEPIFNRLSIFKIRQEANLAEFWEHFLYEGNYFGNEQLCDIIAKIYNLGSLLLKMNVKFSIFYEENEKLSFFTINKTKCINKSVIEEIIKKDGFRGRYRIGDDRVSFSGEKAVLESSTVEKKLIQHEATKDVTIDDNANANIKIEKEADGFDTKASSPVIVESIETKGDALQVFDFMDEQDFLDLEEYIKDLDSILMLMQSSKLEVGDVDNIAYKIEKIASTLSTYNETYELGTSLRSLSFDIKENIEAFIGNCSRLSTMFFSFTRDLLDWFSKVFRYGAPSINFMDATIIANAVMISTTIKPHESDDSGVLDDIFF